MHLRLDNAATAPASRIALVLTAALVAAFALVAIASGAMRSTKLASGLCETTGGGKFVDIPGFPGEMIDRRLLKDVRMLQRRYKIFVTDGYSMSDVHSANGEHPVGLALDIAPNTAAGGTWADIDRLAAWAEPSQNQPRTPFRWVGYDGDSGHGRGHHLHLSWDHSQVSPGRTARTVYTVRCPGSSSTPKPPQPAPEPQPEPQPSAGGAIPGAIGTGGIAGHPRLAAPVGESGGVDLN